MMQRVAQTDCATQHQQSFKVTTPPQSSQHRAAPQTDCSTQNQIQLRAQSAEHEARAARAAESRAPTK